MGYPKGLLSEGEQIITHKHPHFKMLIFPLLFGALLLAVAIWLGVLAGDASPPWDMVALIAVVVVGLVPVILLSRTIARSRPGQGSEGR